MQGLEYFLPKDDLQDQVLFLPTDMEARLGQCLQRQHFSMSLKQKFQVGNLEQMLFCNYY